MEECGYKQIKFVHQQSGHPGVMRTWYFAKQVDPQITKAQMRMVVKTCKECQSIDLHLFAVADRKITGGIYMTATGDGHHSL